MQAESPILVRKVRPEDLPQLIEVERGSTPGLTYVPNVFDMFRTDASGDFSAAEMDGRVVGCAKFSVLPDGSAWLETLRVLPAYQGRGVGKRFYERFFEIAQQKGITTMRMYTGVSNAASKGLAERFGFRLAASFSGAGRPCGAGDEQAEAGGFQPVTSAEHAVALLMPHHERWNGYLVMNRTFYVLSPALCAHLAHTGMVYSQPASGSVIVLGARFMPEQALHVGLFGGDADACLAFAVQLARERGIPRLSCLCPRQAEGIQADLTRAGFSLETSDFIVMESRQAEATA